MEDESKKEEYDPNDSKMSKTKGSTNYGNSQSRPSSYLQDSGSKVKILESKSNKTLKVAWNPKNHNLVFGGDNEYGSLWNLDDNVSEAQLIKLLPHIARDPGSNSSPESKTTINSIDWNREGTKFITGASDGI